MAKTGIRAALPKLTPEERKILAQALAEFEADHDPGTPWRDVFRRLCARVAK